MQRLPSRKRVAAVAALCIATGLAACGGGDDAGGSGGDASFDPGPVEVAKGGSERAVGERAFVEYEGLGPKFEPDAKTTLGVTVREVVKGDSGDIDGLGESTTPYYVHLEYENHGDAPVLVLGLDSHLSVRGSDGEDYDTEGVVEISGEFEKCPDADPDAPLAPEQAINDCVVVTVAEGASPEQVRFRGNLVADEEPLAWTVG